MVKVISDWQRCVDYFGRPAYKRVIDRDGQRCTLIRTQPNAQARKESKEQVRLIRQALADAFGKQYAVENFSCMTTN